MIRLRHITLVLFSAVSLLHSCPIFSQDFLGYVNSNYAGVSGINLNPACIADSRYKFDMTLVGFNLSFANNYIGLKREAIQNKNTAFKDPAFKDKYIIERKNSDRKSLFVSNQIVAPSFMLTLSPKHAIAIDVLRMPLNINYIISVP